MLSIDVCSLPETGGSTVVVVAALFLLVIGVVVTRWVRQSSARLSVVVAPLVLLGGLALAPSIDDPCVAPTTTTIAPATTVSPATVAPTTTAAQVGYQVGDTGPGGGIIFYDAGTEQPWGRYLEVACAGWTNNCDGATDDPGAEWGCYESLVDGADETAIGTGEQNTLDIVTFGCFPFRLNQLTIASVIAADLAGGYSNNGFDDWFLPSKDELNALCKWAQGDTTNVICNDDGNGGLRSLLGGLTNDEYYWSSSEAFAVSTWDQYLGTGGQGLYDKYSDDHLVRPIRAF